ncbi:MAG: Kelch repeat-containing protein [Fibrobacteria bacterium]|jgi:hypothetical protein|nr:Kelch repeat-containing protein [Fibrobacteria bacterium]
MNFHKNATVALSVFLAAFAVSNAAVGDTVRVNSGATAPYTDTKGQVWAADSGFVGGEAYSATAEIAGTDDDALHTDERWDDADFSYTFNMKQGAGSYIVGLYEATLWDGACGEGTRVFNVDINGTQVLTDYDMSKEVGCLTAQVKRFVVTSADGKITITFKVGAVQNPKINAIEIYPGTVIGIQGQGKANAGGSKLSIASSKGGFTANLRAEGAYTLELSDLQGKRIGIKQGFGDGAQTFSNLKPGVYFLTSRVGSQTVTRTVSVLR